MAKKKKDEDIKKINDEAIEGVLLPYNPLVESHAISVDDENEQKLEIIEQTQSLAKLNENMLKVEQQKANLEIELKKIGTSKKLTYIIDNLVDLGLTEEVLSSVIDNIQKPHDFKLYTEALKNLTEIRDKNAKSLNRDDEGRRRRTKITAEFQTQFGERSSIEVDINNNNYDD